MAPFDAWTMMARSSAQGRAPIAGSTSAIVGKKVGCISAASVAAGRDCSAKSKQPHVQKHCSIDYHYRQRGPKLWALETYAKMGVGFHSCPILIGVV